MNLPNLPDTCHSGVRLVQSKTWFSANWRLLVACLLNLWLLLPWQPSLAQTSPASAPTVNTKPPPPRPTTGLTLPTTFTGLDWNALTPAQQLALRPLAGKWNDLNDQQKRKWISLSTNFTLMTPSDQARLHTRMAQWAALSPKQREQARLNFAEVQKIAPEQKTEKWQAYQALPPEEKQKLATVPRPKAPSTALAAKPTAPGKLNPMPLQPATGGGAISTSAQPVPGNIALPASQARASAPQPTASDDVPKP